MNALYRAISALPFAMIVAALYTGSPGTASATSSPHSALQGMSECIPSSTTTVFACSCEHGACSATVTVTPSGGQLCKPCHFSYTISMGCPTPCEVPIPISGTLDIPCDSSSRITAACPYAASTFVRVNFNCTECFG